MQIDFNLHKAVKFKLDFTTTVHICIALLTLFILFGTLVFDREVDRKLYIVLLFGLTIDSLLKVKNR